MVEYGVRICFPETCDCFVLGKHRCKPFLQVIAAPNSGPKQSDATVFTFIKHWHFRFAAPAPEHFHCR